MTNTTATAAATKRSNSAEDAGPPPAKRPRTVEITTRTEDGSEPSWSDLRPELIGHIARFLPMGTPDMMRLLLCVGPRVASVVRKRYLTNNDYYLCRHYREYDSLLRKNTTHKAADKRMGFWMQHNEEAWKKRCLGKAHQDNFLSVWLTPDQIEDLELEEDGGASMVMYQKQRVCSSPEIDETHWGLKAFAKDDEDRLVLISVGGVDVDYRMSTTGFVFKLVYSTEPNSEGKIHMRFMRWSDALFAYPDLVIAYGLLDVLKFMIEERIIKPDMTMSIFLPQDDTWLEFSLLFHALKSDDIDCFRYLLSLPGTDINAVAFRMREGNDNGKQLHDIIHCCVDQGAESSKFLEAIIGQRAVDLDDGTIKNIQNALKCWRRSNSRER